MPFKTKHIFLSAFLAISLLEGCAKPEYPTQQPSPPPASPSPLSPVDQLISRPDCQVHLIGENEENRRLRKTTGINEISITTLEFLPDSKVMVNIEYKTYFSPGDAFDFRVTHAEPVSLSYVKTAQGLLILTKDNSPLALLKLKALPHKAELSYFDDNLSRQLGKCTSEFTIRDCRH